MIPFKKQVMTPDIRKRFAKTKYPREVIFRLLNDLKPGESIAFPFSEVPYNTMRSRVYDFNYKVKREDGEEMTVVGCDVPGE
jgi:hypothetical protein